MLTGNSDPSTKGFKTELTVDPHNFEVGKVAPAASLTFVLAFFTSASKTDGTIVFPMK
jgi:hypothetical protein